MKPPSYIAAHVRRVLVNGVGGNVTGKIISALGGTPVQLYDQARDGVVDIIWTLPGNTAGRFPLMEVFELPFMARDAESHAADDRRKKEDEERSRRRAAEDELRKKNPAKYSRSTSVPFSDKVRASDMPNCPRPMMSTCWGMIFLSG